MKKMLRSFLIIVVLVVAQVIASEILGKPGWTDYMALGFAVAIYEFFIVKEN
ncbi:hypothetical protein IID19_01530 [Patescibacteria group bacterium]|nr:hypothetical protein [Patescibacteria group bacterium]